MTGPALSQQRAPAGRRAPSWRLGWMLPAGIALLAGLDAGLLLLGLPAPIDTGRLAETHGMLLALGFVGTLIALERATALGRWYGYLAPALLGVGGILMLPSPVPLLVGKAVLVAGTAAFTLVYLPLWRRQYDAPLLTQLLAAALATCGAIIWLGQDSMLRVVPWLIGFLVLTIASERVELARITMGPTAGRRLLVHGWAVVAALLIGLASPDAGAVLLGLVLLSLVGWLIVHDVARRTIRSAGVTRYMAACILAGYVWLAVAGAVLLFGEPVEQPAYDAVIHAVFLGYTFSMIMAHATTILPAVLRIELPYRAAFWAPIALLQLALVIRLWLGDGFGLPLGWQLGGVLGVAALLLFLLTAVVSAVIGPPRPAASRGLDAAASPAAPAPATLPPATLPPATLPPATLPPATLPPAKVPLCRKSDGSPPHFRDKAALSRAASERAEPSEATDPTEPSEASEQANPSEQANSSDPVDLTDAADPAEPSR